MDEGYENPNSLVPQHANAPGCYPIGPFPLAGYNGKMQLNQTDQLMAAGSYAGESGGVA
jgi:hypothetical protein